MLVLSLVIICTEKIFAQAGNWIQKTSPGIKAPTARTQMVCFTINGKSYGGTGHFEAEGLTNDFWEYDPITDKWTQKADFPGKPRSGAVGFAIGDKGYLGTGYSKNLLLMAGSPGVEKDFWQYDPVTDKWHRKNDFPGPPTADAVAFSIGDKGYLASGAGPDFWEYNPVPDSWKQMPDFAGIPRSSAFAFVIGGKGYIGGGASGGIMLSDLWEFDPFQKSWRQMADLPVQSRRAMSAVGAAGKGYVGLGHDYNPEAKEFYAFDPVSNSWSITAAFPGRTRHGAASFAIHDKIYVGSGTFGVENSIPRAANDMYVFDPSTDSWRAVSGFRESGRLSAVGFSVNGKGYLGLGSDNTINGKKDFWEYDPASNDWTSIPDYPGLSGGYVFDRPVAFGLGNRGYVGSTDFWEYNPSDKTWTKKADFPGAVAATFAFSIGDKGYAGTGGADFWQYDPPSDQWIKKADFPGVPRTGALALSIGSKGYMGTGSDLADFWEYDADADIWMRKADVPQNSDHRGRSYGTGFSLDNKGYVGLGSAGWTYDPDWGVYMYNKQFWQYDPYTNVWTEVKTFKGVARVSPVGFNIGNKGYIGTGYIGMNLTGNFWEFDLQLPPDPLPIVEVKLDHFINDSTPLIDGSASYDPQGKAIVYAWTIGCCSHVLGNADTVSFTFPRGAEYTVRLTVTNEDGVKSWNEVKFLIKGRPPVANGWLMKYNSPTSVLMNAWGSYDPDGRPVKFWWEKVSGPSQYTILYPEASTPVISDLVAGTYVFRLTVTDIEGQTDTSDVTFTILVNLPPIAGAWFQKYLNAGSALLAAWGSSDPEGGPITYLWEKTAGPAGAGLLYGNSASPVVIGLVNGTYSFRLTVTDNQGATGTTSVSFTVSNNLPPVAGAWLQKYYSPTSALLAAWDSHDPEGGPISYLWEKIAGPEGSTLLYGNSASPVINGLVNGTYTFRLTVTDNQGATGSKELTFTVSGVPLSSNRAHSIIPPENANRKNTDQFVIYPNPIKEMLSFRWDNDYTGSSVLTVMDISGRKIKEIRINKTGEQYQGSIELTGLKAGYYYLHIRNESSYFSKPFFKE
jgi:N-acetylneuraminic acid mutarotase